MMLLDVLLRYPTVTLLLLLALLAWRDGAHLKPARYAALLSISIAALLLGTSYPGLELPTVLHVIVRVADVPSVAFIWWFGLSLFDDDFELGAREWLGMTAVVIPVMYFRLADLSIVNSVPLIVNIATLVISLVLMAHLAYVTISGREDDVIESRRRFRFFFLLALVVVTVLIVVSERVIDLRFSVELSIFRSAAILPLALWASLWLMRFRTEELSFETVNRIAPSKPALDPRDHALHATLIRLVSVDNAYKEPGLTIRSLAEQLNTPEHRLRALINKGMGYRNFSSFLNHYRIAAVKEAMQQPDNARTPILTLAMDVGFNSIATFNRAFLNESGVTPSEYRSKLLNDTDQN